MKKIILIQFFVVIAQIINAQITIDGKDLNADSSIQFISLIGVDVGLFKKKLVVTVDYGQKIPAFDTDMTVKGPDGKVFYYQSMTGALNFFYENGWDLVGTDVEMNAKIGAIYRWLLRRRK